MATKKSSKVKYSWSEEVEYTKSNGKKGKKNVTRSGHWQLRIDYTMTADEIKNIKPYIVITGDGLKKAHTCTLSWYYYHLEKKSGTGSFVGNDWDKKDGKKTRDMKSAGTHYFKKTVNKKEETFVIQSLHTYKIVFSAHFNGETVSGIVIQNDDKPPKPVVRSYDENIGGGKTVKNVTGLGKDALYDWVLRFNYEPKKGTPDYTIPVDGYVIERLQDYESGSFSSIFSKNTGHDVNGFKETVHDVGSSSTEIGHRYKWKVTFLNSNGGSSITLPAKHQSNNSGKKTDIFDDKIKEWAYMPPEKISTLEAYRTNNGVTLRWTRTTSLVEAGIYRGYHFQYQINDGIDNTKSWKDLKNSKDEFYTTVEDVTNPPEYLTEKVGKWTKNVRVRFRLKPYNFRFGTVVNYRRQYAYASDPSEIIYFTPYKPKTVTAVQQEDTTYKLTITLGDARYGSVDSMNIYRKVKYSDGTEDPNWTILEEGEPISVNRDHETEEYIDYEALPTGGVKVKYAVEFGCIDVDNPPSEPWSDKRESDWVSTLSKPKVPTLLFPESNKNYIDSSESVRLSWMHNPTDGTIQEQAKIRCFVFPDGVDIPDDFFSAGYSVPSADVRNEITISDNTSYYDLPISEHTMYKITEIDTVNKAITLYSSSVLTANDKIVWQVQTKGSYSTASNFSTELRPFNLCGAPTIQLFIQNQNNGVLSNLPAILTWNYNDPSGTMDSLIFYLIQNNTIIASYALESLSESSYNFRYLFDNDSVYTIQAVAVSSTTLTAIDSIEFTVSYINVQLRNSLSITTDFNEHTGYSTITLGKNITSQSGNDSEEVVIGGTTQTGTRTEIWYRVNFDEENGHLTILALLSRTNSGITFTTANPPYILLPADDSYPRTVYPTDSITTDDAKVSYILFDAYVDTDVFGDTVDSKITLNASSGKILSNNSNEEILRINFIDGTIVRAGTETPIEMPIATVIVDEVDEAAPEETPIEIIDEDAVEAYLYRYYRGEKTFIGYYTINYDDDKPTVSTIIDKFCPINRDFKYQMIQLTESGHVSYSEITDNYSTLYWYCYWGDAYENVVKARWNPQGSASFSRPERQSIRYSGRKYPVIYDSDAREETYSFTTELYEDEYMIDVLNDDETALETIELYKELMNDGGVGFWKSFEGDVYFATFDFSYTVDFTDRVKKYPCSLTVTRIEGEEVF